ncbi:MAG: hypothetical protein PHX21_01330 [bacterium]|nr:hypothetical protein [bacterium]
MKKLFIVFVIFSANIFADSTNNQITGVEMGARAPIYPLCLTPSIGLKPSDLTLTDAYEYKRGKAFASFGGEYSADESELNCCLIRCCTFGKIDPRIERTRSSWMITELLGGLLGGGVGGGIVGIAAGSAFEEENQYKMVVGAIIGYSIGCGIGIWTAGSLIEKEKGDCLWATVGSIVGATIIYFKFQHDYYRSATNTMYDFCLIPILPLISGLTLYRLTLGKSSFLGIK